MKIVAGGHQKQDLATNSPRWLHRLRSGPYRLEPRAPYLDGELSIPIVHESHAPIDGEQRRFSPEEILIIRPGVDKLLDCGINRPWKCSCAAHLLCVREKDGRLKLCVDWHMFNRPLVLESPGLEDTQAVFANSEASGISKRLI